MCCTQQILLCTETTWCRWHHHWCLFIAKYSWSGVMERFTVVGSQHCWGLRLRWGGGTVHVNPWRDRMCTSWTSVTWRSPLSDVISMIQRSIESLPWTPTESCLRSPPSLWRVCSTKSFIHPTVTSTLTERIFHFPKEFPNVALNVFLLIPTH